MSFPEYISNIPNISPSMKGTRAITLNAILQTDISSEILAGSIDPSMADGSRAHSSASSNCILASGQSDQQPFCLSFRIPCLDWPESVKFLKPSTFVASILYLISERSLFLTSITRLQHSLLATFLHAWSLFNDSLSLESHSVMLCKVLIGILTAFQLISSAWSYGTIVEIYPATCAALPTGPYVHGLGTQLCFQLTEITI